MKVLHVIPAIGKLYGGPSISIIELVESIAKCGIQTDIVTTNANGNHQLNVPLQTWIEENGYRTQYFPYWKIKDYKISPSMAQWLFRHVRDYDLVNTHAIFSSSILPAYWSCQRYQIPYVIHPHGMLDMWALAYKRWKKLPYYTLLEKPALARASAIRVLASSEAESIKHLGVKTPLASIPNGIWQQNFVKLAGSEHFYQAFPQTRDRPLILFLGRIDPKKGLDLLATAFAKVHHMFPQAHLVIAGPDNIGFLSTVQGYFAQAGCLNAVTFTGMLTGSMKYSVLAAASIYAAPSYSEGFSISVLEGMAAELPCVITVACNFPEAALAEAACVVDIDANEIANALIQCLSNPQQAKEIGNRARQLIFNHYTWEKIGTKMIEVYTKIINKEIVSPI